MSNRSSPLAIACAINEAFVQHCAVLLTSLLEQHPTERINLYIIYNGVKAQSRHRLESYLKDAYQQAIHWIAMDATLVRRFPMQADDHVSYITYFRLFLASLLPPTVSKILFLDSDMIVERPLTTLWKTDINSYALAAVSNPSRKKQLVRLHLPDSADYFNAGVLLLNLSFWRTRQIEKEFLAYLENYPARLQQHDQDVLNAVLWNRCLFLSETYNCIEHFATIKRPHIVHFAGRRKPWNIKSRHPYQPAYYRYLAKTPWKNYSPFWEYVKSIFRYFFAKN